jgi:hypothetical protein
LAQFRPATSWLLQRIDVQTEILLIGPPEQPKIKEVSQELADLFGLTLLVSLKKLAHTTAGDQLVPEPHATISFKERVETSS